MENYILRLRRSWLQQDGMTLSSLLSLRQSFIPRNQDLASPSLKHLPPPLDELVKGHVRTMSSLPAGDFSTTFTYHNTTVQFLVKVLQTQKDENWMLPVMYTMCLELRLLAAKVDKFRNAKINVKPNESLEKCAETLMSCFRICAADNRSSEDDTKRWGMLYLVNQMFKVYFKINRLHLCKPLIRAIDSSAYKDEFPLAQQITYKFFVGRKSMFDSNFKLADEYLSFAFEHCHLRSKKNKQLILHYLIPVKMSLGYMPTKHVLKKYNLMQFWDLVQAVKRGHIHGIDVVKERYESFLINAGIYLIVEKLKLIAYRNLFKRVYIILNNHQIDISSLHKALLLSTKDEEIDLSETECIVANLIYENKIKGYISKPHMKLVVSKQNAFPKLSACIS